LLARDKENNNLQRSLMLAYSHIGDVLLEPAADGSIQHAEALQAYLQMSGIAEELHKADPVNFRALTDLGIATMRVANAVQQPSEKLRRYQEALRLLKQAAHTSNDRMLQMNRAFIETRIGDLLKSSGQASEANRHYRDAIPIGEQLLDGDPRNFSVRRTLMDALRAVGEEAARRHARADAAECREKLLNLAEQVKQQRGAPPRMQALVARADAGVGAILAAGGEIEGARARYELAVQQYRRLQQLPGFVFMKELREAESALARLKGASPSASSR
jgi:tetratricopeptide (TPR) repeat protein